MSLPTPPRSQTPLPDLPSESNALAKRFSPPQQSQEIQSSDISAQRLEVADEINVRTDGPPPKRRRVGAPRKPRATKQPLTTKRIDLENAGEEDEKYLARLLEALRKKKKIVVIAGAGISVSAGIPDFRSQSGLFATLRGGKHLFDASVYQHGAATSEFHAMVRELAKMSSQAQPTEFHHMLATIAVEGRLMRLYTQNIDCIDTRMEPLATQVPLKLKGPWPRTIQLHGGLEKMVCLMCGEVRPFQSELFDGPEPPLCQECVALEDTRINHAGQRSRGIGRLRPRMVLYNESSPDDESIGKVAMADLNKVPDAVLVVGTSLKIPGVQRMVKEMCQVTRSKPNGITAWINIDDEPQGAKFKDCWDFVVRGKCDDLAGRLHLPRWNDVDSTDSDKLFKDDRKPGESVEVAIPINKRNWSEVDDLEMAASSGSVGVATKTIRLTPGGIPTPTASPNPGRGRPKGSKSTTTKAGPRQTKLSFPTHSSAEESTDVDKRNTQKVETHHQPSEMSKKRGRKPRSSQKPLYPLELNSLTRSFKATKPVSSGPKATKQECKLDSEPEIAVAPSSPSTGLPSFGPKHDPGAKGIIRVQEYSDGLSQEPSAMSKDCILGLWGDSITLGTSDFSRSDTISPSSKPRNMDALIS